MLGTMVYLDTIWVKFVGQDSRSEEEKCW